MKVKRFEWAGARRTARSIRLWATGIAFPPDREDMTTILERVLADGDAAVLDYTQRFDAPDNPPTSLRVPVEEARRSLDGLDPALRESLEVAAANIRTVAEAQGQPQTQQLNLPQGQTVTLRELPVGAAGVYAPGGKAAYPSTVLMCCIPAQVAGVGRIALASPPTADGRVHQLVLAAAALCGVEEIYAMGGAQAIFALAYGTETVDPVDVVVGPGNAWVREAKQWISGERGIDSLAGPSELMVVAGHDTDPEWIALDLCAQAEHGDSGPLIVTAVEERVLDAVEAAVAAVSQSRVSVADGPLAVVHVPDAEAAIDLANAFAPEHLELLEEDAALLASSVTTAGCVFAGRHSATAFGDYVAGSNHVLPTGGAGRFSGPLGPQVFRRKISTVEVPADAAAKLAPHVDAIARAEGFPVHGESAMIRSKS
ncbi:MAG: histidinol dehydrogenase [Solirubrobacterales bacterium]